MKRKQWLSVGGIIVIIVILGIFLASVLKPEYSSANELTEQEAIAIAEQRYTGAVKAISQKKDRFIIEMERDTGLYELQLDAVTGEVSSLKKLETRKEDAKVEEQEKLKEEIMAEEEKKTEKETDPVDVSKRLTEAEAIDIALQQVPGTLDDVDEENINGILFFLVEIESNDGREATVEINSITRKIESLTWDDHEDDDDEE